MKAKHLNFSARSQTGKLAASLVRIEMGHLAQLPIKDSSSSLSLASTTINSLRIMFLCEERKDLTNFDNLTTRRYEVLFSRNFRERKCRVREITRISRCKRYKTRVISYVERRCYTANWRVYIFIHEDGATFARVAGLNAFLADVDPAGILPWQDARYRSSYSKYRVALLQPLQIYPYKYLLASTRQPEQIRKCQKTMMFVRCVRGPLYTSARRFLTKAVI